MPTRVRSAAGAKYTGWENRSARGVALTTRGLADDLTGGVDVAKDMPAPGLVGEAG